MAKPIGGEIFMSLEYKQEVSDYLSRANIEGLIKSSTTLEELYTKLGICGRIRQVDKRLRISTDQKSKLAEEFGIDKGLLQHLK